MRKISKLLVLLILLSLIVSFVGCREQEGIQEEKVSEEIKEAAAKHPDTSPEELVKKMDQMAAFVIVTLRNYFAIAEAESVEVGNYTSAVLNNLMPGELTKLVSIDGKNWGNVPEEESVDKFYVLCGYNSKDSESF